jgi:hypothetical protein
MAILQIVPGIYTAQVRQALAACCRSAVYTIDDLALQIYRGAKLFEVQAEGAPVGWFVLDVADRANGREGVVLAAAGKLTGVQLAQSVLPDIERRFKEAGCAVIRFQTHRRGLVRVMARAGFFSTHVTMAKGLA